MRMRRILTVLAVVCLIVGVMATAGSARGRHNQNHWEVIVLPNPEAEVNYDWGWTLYEELTTTDGEHLGWSGGPCFNLNTNPQVFEDFVCTFGMRFPDGDITVNGALNFDEYVVGETLVSVTGGTGAFRNITGEVAIIPADDFSYSTLVFNVKQGKASY